MKLHLLLAILFGLFLAVRPVAAQTADGKPTMNPETATGTPSKKDPFGMTGLTKDRPKGATTEITAKKQATFDNATSIAEFEGNVVVKDPQFTLFCDRLRVTLSKDRKGLQLVEAFGDGRDRVIIVQDNVDDSGKSRKSTGRSAKAVYEPESGDVTLTVWPSVQHDINMQVATEEGTVMILNREGRLTTKGSSKTVIVDAGDARKY